MSCIGLYLSLVAVEKLVQMDGRRKPQTQKRWEAAFGIQTTKEECGLMKETKIKPELYSLHRVGDILLLWHINLRTG